MLQQNANTAFIFPLIDQHFGKSIKHISIIPHRSLHLESTEPIIQKIRTVFAQLLTQQTIAFENEKTIVLRNSLMLSSVVELLITAIKSAGYQYNQEVFICIDCNNRGNHEVYEIDELAFEQSVEDVRGYYQKIADAYNPLIIANPFSLSDIKAYQSLHLAIGEKTLLTASVEPKDNTSLFSAKACSCIWLDMHSASQREEIVNAIANIHKYKLKAIVSINNPRFIEYFEPKAPDFIHFA